jgi:hypothetical protein
MDQAHFPWRPLGRLLVDKGLLTATDLEHALGEQRRSGRLLGQILVARGYVTALSLAQALAEQHGVELEATGALETRAAASSQSVSTVGRGGTWRPLGSLLVAKAFVSETELEEALREQQRRGRRLGEILVERGQLSGAALALALAEQHGLELGSEEELDANLQTTIRPARAGEPRYRVHEVFYEPAYRPGPLLYESANFLEAADFACEFVERRSPGALEIHKIDGGASETVWTYSESRAAAEASSRKSLVQTFGFDPMRWDTRGQFDTDTTAR